MKKKLCHLYSVIYFYIALFTLSTANSEILLDIDNTLRFAVWMIVLFCREGKSGLDELHVMIRKTTSAQHGNVNDRFHQFSSVLFSSCIDFERSIQTREINDKLDCVIRSFLIEISAYLYMKPTRTSPPHKALEWLVYRSYFVSSIL